MSVDLPVLKPGDFASDQDVRWCPGCGDYSILAQMKKMLPALGMPREKIVFVSGIGCSSRFPYYMNTYGLHSIHGRAPAFATGVKTVNPELMVWVITGDGDGLSIGGNHLMHCIRRNVDVNIVLFNNRIYGLTKGQYSPTSPLGKKTKSTPYGSLDNPLHPLSIAIGCEATFVARSIDTNTKHLGATLQRAAEHKGTSFIEVYQNCNVFNDGAWKYATDRNTKADSIIELEHGKPLIFGKDRDKGIRLNGLEPEVVELGKGITEDDLLFHDEKAPEPSLAYLLSRMNHPHFPEPIGVLRAVDAPRYDQQLNEQVQSEIDLKGVGELQDLFDSGETWTIDEDETSPASDASSVSQTNGAASHASNGSNDDENEDLPVPATAVERALLEDHLDALAPKTAVTCSPDTTVGDVLKLMVEKSIGAVMVVDDGKYTGIFSERDVLLKLSSDSSEDYHSKPISEFMTQNPETLEITSKVAFAVQRMDLGGYRHVPVVDTEGKSAGVISVRDILRYLTDRMTSSDK